MTTGHSVSVSIFFIDITGFFFVVVFYNSLKLVLIEGSMVSCQLNIPLKYTLFHLSNENLTSHVLQANSTSKT